MREHEACWPGPDNVPITVGTIPVENSNQIVVNGVSYDNNSIEKKDFFASRRTLNGNTQRKTVAQKDPKLAKELERRCYHMEKRFSVLVEFG